MTPTIRAPQILPPLLFGASFVLYLLSLTLPAYKSCGEIWSGAAVLAVGWMAVPGGVVAWLANPALICAAIASMRGKHHGSSVFSIISLLLALSILLFKKTPAATAVGEVWTPFAVLCGYYVWLGSIALHLVASLLELGAEEECGDESSVDFAKKEAPVSPIAPLE